MLFEVTGSSSSRVGLAVPSSCLSHPKVAALSAAWITAIAVAQDLGIELPAPPGRTSWPSSSSARAAQIGDRLDSRRRHDRERRAVSAAPPGCPASAPTSLTNGRCGTGGGYGSPGRRSRRSRRAVTPCRAPSRVSACLFPDARRGRSPPANGANELRPRRGLSPTTPQHEDGIRIEPVASEPDAAAPTSPGGHGGGRPAARPSRRQASIPRVQRPVRRAPARSRSGCRTPACWCARR